MRAEETWRTYAEENLAIARLAMEGGYYNGCLRNAQQAVEKYLKAALIEKGMPIPKTHNIELLNRELAAAGLQTGLTDDECELLDAIYIPSKYPAGAVIPDFNPGSDICRQCIAIADKVKINT